MYNEMQSGFKRFRDVMEEGFNKVNTRIETLD